MLATLNDVCIPAQKGSYAVGLFNTVNYEMARAVLGAAEETRSPVIIGTAEVLLDCSSLEELSYFLIPMAKKASVPVVVHLDHGLTYEKCLEALQLGFSSIMYDCSLDAFEENARKVSEIAKIAHCFGASIEAELGHVGSAGEAAENLAQEASFTLAKEAKAFAECTNVDALAIAVGTAHGAYQSAPHLNYARIREIASCTDVPLVLHGGSGLSDEAFQTAIASGISKINIFTDVSEALREGARSALEEHLAYGFQMIPYEVDFMKQVVLQKMKVFQCVNRV